ncbi:unnamed protein product [Ixodes pacificus]
MASEAADCSERAAGTLGPGRRQCKPCYTTCPRSTHGAETSCGLQLGWTERKAQVQFACSVQADMQ